MSDRSADAFIEALGRLERDRDVDTIVGLYADDAVAGNVLRPDEFKGKDGAREFWAAYRDEFGEISSTFRNVVVADGAVALEWSTEGTIDGAAISYAGVTVLELDGDKIRRSCAYYDPSALTRPRRD